jgi:ABC-2 type transport system ATP-binding protein
MSIEVRDLVKNYGAQRAVDSVSFHVRPGDVMGFLGPNGAGKSTTMKIATGYIPATEGSVEVCGFPVDRASMEVKKRIGYLPEHNPLYLDMYVHEYLRFVGAVHGLKGATLTNGVADIIFQTGLVQEQNKKIGALSKGYRQRVGLAQALLHNPEVVILDEPTSGLDPNQIVEIRRLIKSLSKDKTVILSTHIMQEVQAVCNRVVIIHQGKIVADSPTELLGQQKVQSSTLIVEFAHDEVKASFFSDVEGTFAPQKKSPGVWEVRSNVAMASRAAIVQKAGRLQLPLIGLKEEEYSLEQIFRSLTQSTKS